MQATCWRSFWLDFFYFSGPLSSDTLQVPWRRPYIFGQLNYERRKVDIQILVGNNMAKFRFAHCCIDSSKKAQMSKFRVKAMLIICLALRGGPLPICTWGADEWCFFYLQMLRREGPTVCLRLAIVGNWKVHHDNVPSDMCSNVTNVYLDLTWRFDTNSLFPIFWKLNLLSEDNTLGPMWRQISLHMYP